MGKGIRNNTEPPLFRYTIQGGQNFNRVVFFPDTKSAEEILAYWKNLGLQNRLPIFRAGGFTEKNSIIKEIPQKNPNSRLIEHSVTFIPEDAGLPLVLFFNKDRLQAYRGFNNPAPIIVRIYSNDIAPEIAWSPPNNYQRLRLSVVIHIITTLQPTIFTRLQHQYLPDVQNAGKRPTETSEITIII